MILPHKTTLKVARTRHGVSDSDVEV